MTPEGRVKDYFRKQCLRRGLTVMTTIVVGRRGWPDREIHIGCGVTVYVELKAEDAHDSAEHHERQLRELRNLAALGHPVMLLRGIFGVNKGLEALDTWIRAGMPAYARPNMLED